MNENHSDDGKNAYAQLLAYHKEKPIASIKGEPVLEETGNGQFWYDKHMAGTVAKYALIGKDSPELSEQLGRIGEIRQQMASRHSRIHESVQVLREDSYQFFDEYEGNLLAEFAAAGVFRLGGILIGSYAFICYEYVLGVRMTAADLIKTTDIDIASVQNLEFPLNETVSPAIPEILQNLSFEEVLPPNSMDICKWRNRNRELIVEFLTPELGKRRSLKNAPGLTSVGPSLTKISPLGVYAQQLRYLDYLLADPIQAVVLHKNGILVRVPQPMRYAIHKLVVAELRGGNPEFNKSTKDRSQALFLLRKLAADSPEDVHQAIEDAKKRGKKWRRHLENSINRVPEIREILADAAPPCK